MKKLILSFAAMCMLTSCLFFNAPDEQPVWIYRAKADYSNYAYVEMCPDKKTFKTRSSHVYPPYKLEGGYWLAGSIGVNTVYLSISIEKYNDSLRGNGPMDHLVMEKDPYIEFYEATDKNSFLFDGPLSEDTTAINQLIRSNELQKYFKRIK